jgi:nitrogen fixation protein NifB
MALDRSRHPCFDAGARHHYGRIHLPVAPRCNVQCNFCDRRYDCPNESRPGVTSTVLTPTQAVEYLRRVGERIPDLAVVGIAGPGDPFANSEETMETLRLVRDHDPDILLCVATNGLRVGPHVDELAGLGVGHITITINAVDPEIGKQIYAWMRDGTRVVRGAEAARLLLGRQLEAVRALKEKGVTVKVNTIIIPGVNDDHIPEVARTVAGLGADVLNCIPLYPVEGTPFGVLETPSAGRIARVRAEAAEYLPQMSHCARCRADAVGRLGEAMSQEILACLHDCAAGRGSERPYVAVASEEGLLVNLHLGEAETLMIFGPDGNLVESRPTPPTGLGIRRWVDLADLLKDCRAVLVSGAGETPRQVLAEAGVRVQLTEGLVADTLDALYQGRAFAPPRREFRCGEACAGQGNGCG